MYRRLYAHPDRFIDQPRTASYFEDFFPAGEHYLEQVLRAEMQTKMVDDFLVNEDRVTSAYGIEGRVPFLDREFVELALRVPADWKMAGRETKHFWKACVGDTLPPAILHKKKQGFTFSSSHQWDKDLRAAVKNRLTREWCEDIGLFRYDFVGELLDRPSHPNLRWHYFMAWMMLGVREWLEVFEVRL